MFSEKHYNVFWKRSRWKMTRNKTWPPERVHRLRRKGNWQDTRIKREESNLIRALLKLFQLAGVYTYGGTFFSRVRGSICFFLRCTSRLAGARLLSRLRKAYFCPCPNGNSGHRLEGDDYFVKLQSLRHVRKGDNNAFRKNSTLAGQKIDRIAICL